jgi:hypothetical protein
MQLVYNDDLYHKSLLTLLVLQSNPVPQGKLTDDGSLSYYCALLNLTYINIESAAPNTHDIEGFALINQLGMLYTLGE